MSASEVGCDRQAVNTPLNAFNISSPLPFIIPPLQPVFQLNDSTLYVRGLG